MILVWNVVVGVTFGVINRGAVALGFAYLNNDKHDKDPPNFHGPLTIMLATLGFIALIQFFFYPVGGLIADLKYGRYKIVSLSTFKIWCGVAILLVLTVLLSTSEEKKYEINKGRNGPAFTGAEIAILAVAVILFIFGFTGFQANSVQFGLDQLQDAPSAELSAFLHWFVWTDSLGWTVMAFLVSLIPCNDDTVKWLVFTPIPIFAILTAFLLLGCWKRSWFHSEPCTHNPYGTVYRVLKYVARHNKPERPRAETYCDTERASRIEYAKERFGGPFTAETVEDVKTFLRVVVMLFAVGPIHTLFVALNVMFPLHALHTGRTDPFKKHGHCTPEWVLLESGNLAYLVTVVCLPLYIVFVLPCKWRFLRRIFSRLNFGMFLMILTAIAIFVTHIVGQYHFMQESGANHTNVSCMFNANYSEKSFSPTLQLPSWVHVFPNVLNGIANPLVCITILEFVSSQSPHTMKGLLLGAYYAMRGLFTFIGYSLVFPFAIPHAWKKHDDSLFDCGVSYFFFNVVFGMAGLGLLLAVSRWYQYRQRGEIPYEPWGVEEIYQRFIGRRQCRVPLVRSPPDAVYSQ